MTTGHYKNLHSVWHWVKDCPNLRLCVFWVRLHYEIHTRKLWMFICYWALLIPREENTFFTLLQVKQFLLIHSTQSGTTHGSPSLVDILTSTWRVNWGCVLGVRGTTAALRQWLLQHVPPIPASVFLEAQRSKWDEEITGVFCSWFV